MAPEAVAGEAAGVVVLAAGQGEETATVLHIWARARLAGFSEDWVSIVTRNTPEMDTQSAHCLYT